MFNRNEFMSAVVRNGYTLNRISSDLGINPATLHRKMTGESDFTRNELQMLKSLLKLTNKDIITIFFA